MTMHASGHNRSPRHQAPGGRVAPPSEGAGRQRWRPEPVVERLELLASLVAAEMECAEAEPCRIDVIVSDTPTQVGAREGRIWLRQVQETSLDTNNVCAPLIVTAEIGVLRCHKPTEDGRRMPSPDTMSSETHQVYADKASVKAAIRGAEGVSAIGWRPYGPQGDAIGGIWTVQWRTY